MVSIGEKVYLMRRNYINNETFKKSPLQLRKKKSLNLDYIEISKEQESLDTLIKNRSKLNKEIKLIKLNVIKRLQNNLFNKKKQIKLIKNKSNYNISNSEFHTERTKDFSSSSVNNTININSNNTINNNTIVNSTNNIKKKEKSIIKGLTLKLNLSQSRINNRNKNNKSKIYLDKLNKFTDKLGITKESERKNYINDKEKRTIYENQFLKKFKRNKERKLTLFNSTSRLNNYIINDYYISQNNPESIKKKLEMSELTYQHLNKERKKKIYNESQKYFIEDPDRENFYYNLAHYGEDESFNKGFYSERDMQKLKDLFYDKKTQDKLNKNLKVFEKIRNLNYKDYSFPKGNEIEYKNLDRIMKIKKIKKNDCNDLKKKKEKLFEENDQIMLSLARFKSSVMMKKNFKPSTINQFKTVNGLYFGLPV